MDVSEEREREPLDDRERPDVEPHEDEVAPGDRRLLVAASAAPLAWLAQLGAGFATVRWMCDLDSRLPLAVATVAALAVAGWALAVCRRAATSPAGGGAPGESTAEGAHPALAGARRALAWGGAALATFFLLLIVATAVPGVFLEPCR